MVLAMVSWVRVLSRPLPSIFFGFNPETYLDNEGDSSTLGGLSVFIAAASAFLLVFSRYLILSYFDTSYD